MNKTIEEEILDLYHTTYLTTVDVAKRFNVTNEFVMQVIAKDCDPDYQEPKNIEELDPSGYYSGWYTIADKYYRSLADISRRNI